jgi:hypothetical protein
MGLGNDELEVREWVCIDMGWERVEGERKEADGSRAIGANICHKKAPRE